MIKMSYQWWIQKLKRKGHVHHKHVKDNKILICSARQNS